MNATKVSQVLDACEAGFVLPQKRPNFQPKLATGFGDGTHRSRRGAGAAQSVILPDDAHEPEEVTHDTLLRGRVKLSPAGTRFPV